ncbi:MAG: aminotransferase class I/II-fold pyridoxal phosphate-dependent enzyme, partial [Lachnospiraceae bacterium]|nr:aminotransferase class I/II-fold pyridoxal phosphate-dependent enzyme [Lachnospiraceae bacterium]
IGQTGAVLRVVSADTEQFQINFEALDKVLNPRTMAVLVNTPNNPSGTVYSEDTVKRLAAVLGEKQKEYGHDIFLISDEPYREILFAGVDAPYVSKYYDNSLSCYSFAKSLSIPGERLGYIAANPKCTDSALISPMCAQISRGIGHNCPPSIIQIAVAEVLGITSDLSVYETNMEIIYDELVRLGFEVVKPGGTFYIFPRALEEDSVAFCRKAMDYDLVLVPGDSFGCPGYFRMAYCVETEKVRRAMPALRRFVQAEYGVLL